MFEDDRGRHGQVNFKRRHVDGEVELTNDGGRTWLAFRLLHPPFLNGEPERKESASTLFNLESIFSVLGEIFRNGSVWELDGGFDRRMPEKLGRVGDMSPNVAFGRCLVYRIDVSDLLEGNR
ncbi:hypothetical protein Esi_1242_0002 [Ectocarpus siliculosus]|uniref:Uncharacterized protein n=1 Tax=Ectocarpus siliculosus TaxID=2880 RepID=D7FIY5_ECTSI|nr:hypothetical protein Esi_1242_0002 [Ectocarpus siliculosus]|eukprot:CBJ34179.1 hypothetical protein Esi_1242_0002 [Ectocarpus siliculosus]